GEFQIAHICAGTYLLTAGPEPEMPFPSPDANEPIEVDGITDIRGIELISAVSTEEVAEQDVAARETAKGRITGRVVDDMGQPLAGVQVQARHGFRFGDRQPRKPATSSDSDANGAFTIEILGADEVTLRAECAGYSTATAEHVVTGSDGVLLVLSRLATITGRVTTADGAPSTGFKIMAEPAGEEGEAESFAAMIEGLADGGGDGGEWIAGAADGTFRIEGVSPGKVVVRARVPGFAPGVSEPVTVTAGATLGGVIVHALRGATVRGVVTAKGIGAIPGATARLVPVSGDPNEELMAQFMPAMFQGNGESAQSAEDGSFELARLSAGTYRLLVTHEGYAPAEPITITLANDESFVAPSIELSTGGKIEGIAYTESKENPRSGAIVQLMGTKGGMKMGTTDKEGRFAFEGLAPGEYTITLVEMGSDMSVPSAMKTKSVTLSGAETVAAEFVYGAGHRIRGRVVGRAKDEQVFIVLRRPGGASPEDLDYTNMESMMEAQKFQAGIAVVKHDDTYDVADVEPGKYILEVPVMPEDPTDFEAYQKIDRTPRFRKEIEIDKEDLELDIELAPRR
ncbi:MAG: carboxypeptidase regulatory-like domain-containing protein, partial [Planctomycetes bacterium]|nr:carboxypeptidase regulatory-like domain-containing protein [Planctomycetota bacterium]